MATRLQQRLNAAYAKNPCQATQDAVIGDAIYRHHAARITPTHAAIRQRGLYATATQARKLGISLVDFYICAFGVMPRHV